MKKAFLKLLSLALCAAMLCAAGAAAAEDGASPAHLGPVQVWGTAAWTESGSLFLKNSNESDPNQEIIVHLSDDTVVIDVYKRQLRWSAPSTASASGPAMPA